MYLHLKKCLNVFALSSSLLGIVLNFTIIPKCAKICTHLPHLKLHDGITQSFIDHKNNFVPCIIENVYRNYLLNVYLFIVYITVFKREKNNILHHCCCLS